MQSVFLFSINAFWWRANAIYNLSHWSIGVYVVPVISLIDKIISDPKLRFLHHEK
jgi:hypothetical protein